MFLIHLLTALSISSKVWADLQNPYRKTDMRALYDHLFTGYQKELRPVFNETSSLNIELKFWLKQILKVDERDQIVNVYCWLELYWKDETLTWDERQFSNISRIFVPADKIWKPDILVYNNANMNIDDNELETNAIIHSDGRVILFRSIITSISCQLNLANFPFDQQICYLTFASWSMDGSKLMLEATKYTDNLELYIRNTEWSLSDFKVRTYSKMYDCCPHPFPDVTYFLIIKRSPSYYIFSLVIPSAFITVVTIVGFFTPHSTTGENTEKVSLGVTALLSMAIIMMMVSDEVPATSEVIPLIGKYYIGLIFLIFIAAFTTTITLSYQMRGNSGEEVPAGVRQFFFFHIAANPLISWAFSFQLPKRYRLKHQHPHHTFLFDNNSLKKNGYHLGNNNEMTHLLYASDANGKSVTIQNHGTPPCDNKKCLHLLLERLRCSLEDIRVSVHHENEKRRVAFEWQQVTRMLDRMIMFFYIIVTIVFAVYMLTTRDPDLVLNEELMDSVKK